jgi:hypothetical protein
MFTIKLVEPAREFAVECEAYAFVEGEDGVARLFGYETPYQTEEYKAFFAGINAGHAGPGTYSAYVMNRHGATVASYHWWIENAEGSPLASSGPPQQYGAKPTIPEEMVA